MLLISVLVAPMWLLAAVLFASGAAWIKISIAWARFVHAVPEALSGGAFGRALGQWFVPTTNFSLKKALSRLLLNKEEDWTYFAPVVWNSGGAFFLWSTVLVLRASAKASGEASALVVPCFLVHAYVMGACFTIVGGNELHYVAHLQVCRKQFGLGLIVVKFLFWALFARQPPPPKRQVSKSTVLVFA